jgi:hypothetical protein
MKISHPAVAVLSLAALLGCTRHGGGAVPTTDRSDGQIPVLAVPRVAAGAIAIDGRLDDEAWGKAADTGDFVDPRSGRPVPGSRVNATARACWDERYLYLALTVHDPAPVAPFPPAAVDPHLWERSSAVEVMIQPGDRGDNRDYYEVQVDTAGAIWDTRFDDYNDPISVAPDGRKEFGHQDWSSALGKGISVDRSGGRYTIELAVPWSALHSTRTAVPPRDGDVWRMNLYSFRDGQRDALAWSPLLGQGNFHLASRFGRLRFVAAGR